MDDFENLKITTVTVLLKLSGFIVNLPVVNIALPIVEIPEKYRKKSYVKLSEIPHSKERAGGIVGCVFQDESIGIKRSRKKVFKNCVTMDMQSKVKNINIKLSKGNIHLVGASSEEDGILSGLNLVNHLNYIQYILTLIQTRSITQFEVAQTLLFFKKLIKGEKIKVILVSEKIKILDTGLEILISNYDTYHKLNKNLIIDEVPEYVNQELLKYFILKLGGIEYYEVYLDNIEKIISTPEIISDNLSIVKSKLIMVNFNFKLNFNVDRVSLSKHMRRLGFFSQFDSSSSYAAAIYLPYFKDKGIQNFDSLDQEEYEYFMDNINKYNSCEENEFELTEDEEFEDKKKKKIKVKKITFLVYKSGSVTLSGPGGEIMREAYNKFVAAVESIKKWIKVKGEMIGTAVETKKLKSFL